MVAVVPMAGLGIRAKGLYKSKLPKYKIKLREVPLLERAVSSLEALFCGFRRGGEYKFLGSLISKFGISSWKLISVSNRTSGQASTVFEVTKHIRKKPLFEEVSMPDTLMFEAATPWM